MEGGIVKRTAMSAISLYTLLKNEIQAAAIQQFPGVDYEEEELQKAS